MAVRLTEKQINELFRLTLDLRGRYEKYLEEGVEAEDLLSLLEERHEKEWTATTEVFMHYVAAKLGAFGASTMLDDEYIHAVGTATVHHNAVSQLKTTVKVTKQNNGDTEEEEEEVKAVVGHTGSGYYPRMSVEGAEVAEKEIRTKVFGAMYNHLECIALARDAAYVRILVSDVKMEMDKIAEKAIAKAESVL